MVQFVHNGQRVELHSPTAMPAASAFLWNRKMLIQVTCRGYAVAQFMQPEPAKYAHAPNLEAKTFMQPEQPYYGHHPGRFFYVKDEETGALFSAPYEPVRAPLERFVFAPGKTDVRWHVEKDGVALEMMLSLAANDPVELWSLLVRNHSRRARKLSVYPYFPIGYMSWMNQSARYVAELSGIVANSVTPYQKVADYFKNKGFKDKTFLVGDTVPNAWEAAQAAFEGEGGLHDPTAVQHEELAKGDALYETPVAALQYRIQLAADECREFRFLFGPALDEPEVHRLRNRYLKPEAFRCTLAEYGDYVGQGRGCLQIHTPDAELDHFVNHWVPRQVFYHGDVNRLTTDPQTRNYLQDNMGMSYIRPEVARGAFLHALTQQEPGGAMPDGILLIEGAELKYINQVPHTDHCVWLPVCLQAYLDETNDYALLHEAVKDRSGASATVFERITQAMHWLLGARDPRGLSYIAQGDWCDPMNMVGYKGKGVSGWLSIATAYALKLWAKVCTQMGAKDLALRFVESAEDINRAVNAHLWDGRWYARGITDEGRIFGVSRDREGRMFLNCQSWAMLAGTADRQKQALIMAAVAEHLETPYGPMTLAPPFTRMHEDIGRVTQKFPGSAENGSVYNHDAAFYSFALFGQGESARAYRLLRQMLAGPEERDYLQRGQLPIFIPNYYRGAYREHPRTAGRSSQLFNTGTAAWFYRCAVEGLFGLKGTREGLLIQPQLPTEWHTCSATRVFRGATFQIEIRRKPAISKMEILLDGKPHDRNRLPAEKGRTYQVSVTMP